MDVGLEGRRLFFPFDSFLLSISCLYPVSIITSRHRNLFWQILLKTPYYKQSLLGFREASLEVFLPFLTQTNWTENRWSQFHFNADFGYNFHTSTSKTLKPFDIISQSTIISGDFTRSQRPSKIIKDHQCNALCQKSCHFLKTMMILPWINPTFTFNW